MSRNQQPVNWGRKFQGAAAGFACGSVIGMFAQTLHSGRMRPTPQGLSAALFMGTVLGIGGAKKRIDICHTLFKSTDAGGKNFERFREMCSVGPAVDPELEQLRADVSSFAESF
eukprot:CAMPEP_0197718854 /NCGR_PEP_ID=MMETSP1434-20131217/2842_1 /TAXON_ID=265543 /ORGANISM="Minutocellus polymorphus, Strain CCMP3303" /LENGTH=113 /DNA_ID=CAMNT_0043303547 /DNA_START=166 /DNA_END=505 /DNA_ORIENTATION=-